MPLQNLYSKMNIKDSISSIMANESFGVSYEPIIDLNSMEIFAYEALSRFKHGSIVVSPYEFFKSVHQDIELFFYIESILKRFQLHNRPPDKKLFLNLDPDVAISDNHVAFWIDFFQDTKEVVVEIIENSDEESAEDVEHFMDWMDEYEIPYAYDDFAKPNSIYFTSLLCRANLIKLDMDVLKRIKQHPPYIEVIKGIVKYAKESEKKTVLEGIENNEDLKIAQALGVDYIQGYMFKDKFINVWKNS
ncbi:EAL domain-containing protein [Sulfurimonas sp. SAG-AH-194-L11]|nr:EAL domain-containing protein [Sulfurimonas sp. SAG-AH-194-L11]MDF1876489.1 EAL domain-containing protein [Sulfurimonas sp. SAG-AH-194-L11]